MVNTRRTVSESTPEPSQDTPVTVQAAPSEPNNGRDLQAEEQAVLLRIEQLERLKEQRERLATLEAEFFRAESAPYPGPYRHREDPDRSKRHDVKIDDIPSFNSRFSIQRRHEWLVNLSFAFEAAPYRFHNDHQKIMGALSHMDMTCRVRWNDHLTEMHPDDRRITQESWDTFEKWTLSLIHNTTSLRADVRDQIESAQQKHDQDPREFHTFLYAREQHLPRESEESRALNFFSKLQPALKKEIHRHVHPLPETRDRMVETAVHYWNLVKADTAPKRHRSDDRSPSRKRARRDDRYPDNRDKDKKGKDGKVTDQYRGDTEFKKKGYCYECGDPDHYKSSCPRLRKVQGVIGSSKNE